MFPDNFIIQRISDNRLKISEINLISEIKENSNKKNFCLIPYNNPLKKKPCPRFFEIHKKSILPVSDFAITTGKPFTLKSSTSKEVYYDKINFLKDEIQKGNIYEINYCVEFFSNENSIDAVSVFLKLYELTKAPYSMLVKIDDDFIICASPELFLKKQGNTLSTKPIKGTAKRGTDSITDEKLKQQLYESIKERTENVMAVDVARNDLSRLAERGTVNVNKLYNIETYETVHHMVSTVQCALQKNTSLDKIIEATFPMASMTGAPKIKAMELIDKTENFDRNFYSGAMGIIDENGDFELSVNIRSIFYNQKTKRLSIAVGSAITHLCEPEKEYEECLLKANALLKALNAQVE